jgi:hypothetical protein
VVANRLKLILAEMREGVKNEIEMPKETLNEKYLVFPSDMREIQE